MAISKVVYGGDTLIDLTADTIVPDKLQKGFTAHGADGEPITGTFTIDAEITEQDSLLAQIRTALIGKGADIDW